MKTFEKLESLGFFEWLKEKGFGIGFTAMILDNQPVDSIERTGYNTIAFRWFREKYGLRNSITDFIDDEKGIEWDYEIVIIGTDLDERGNYKPLVDYSIDDETRKFKTYEEAELACLDKLIEIVEKQ